MSPRPVDKEEKRNQIALAALEVYKQKGFSESTVEDIAIQAKVGKGTIYEYFGSKEEIALRLIQKGFLSQNEKLTHNSLKEKDPRQAIQKFLQIAMSELEFLSIIIPVHFEIWSSQKGKALGLNKIMSARFEKLSHHLNQMITEGKKQKVFRSDLNRRAIVSVIISSIDGMILYNTLFQPRKNLLQSQLKELEEIILKHLQM